MRTETINVTLHLTRNQQVFPKLCDEKRNVKLEHPTTVAPDIDIVRDAVSVTCFDYVESNFNYQNFDNITNWVMQILMSELDQMFPIWKMSQIDSGFLSNKYLPNNNTNFYLVPEIKALDSMSADTEKSSSNATEQPLASSENKSDN